MTALAMLSFSALAASSHPPISRGAAQQQAREELSRAIYHRYDDPWPVAVIKWIGREIQHIFDTAAQHAPGGGTGAVLFAVLLIALIAVARWRAGPLRRDPHIRDDVLIVAGKTARQHRLAAQEAAGRADWRTATIEAMRAVARELEERDIIDKRPGRTADELARDAGAELPYARVALASAAIAFDAVAYGGRDGDHPSYATVCAADDAVRSHGRVVAS